MKNYVKPELFYERYEVSQHIADCQWEFKNATEPEACIAHPDVNLGLSITLFTELNGCDMDAKNYENYCYQNSVGNSVHLHMS